MKPTSKRILVVSDNPELALFFKEECVRQGVGEIAAINYCYTTANKNPAAMISAGAQPIDVKNPQFVEIAKNSYDLIFALHCKQIFPAELVESVVCINVHPGFNPYNRGWYPQVFSLINKKEIGATIHVMDADVDHGEIISQIAVDVLSSDTSLDVYQRVLAAEKSLIAKTILKIIDGNYVITAALTDGNYNSIADFKSLCNLNLDSVASLRDHIDLLRALSHGVFKNAYFLDDHGKKIFIRVTLEESR